MVDILLKIKNKGRIGKIIFGICPYCDKYITATTKENIITCKECKNSVDLDLS